MAWRRARYSLFCLNNIILPKVGIGVPSNIYRGPRGPPFAMEGFSPFLQGSQGTPVQAWMGPLHFPHGSPGLDVCVFFASISLLVGRKCVGFPQIFAGVLSSSVRVLSIFYMGPLGLGVCPGVFFARISLLVGRKCVGVPQFSQGSPRQGSFHFPHGSPGLGVCPDV